MAITSEPVISVDETVVPTVDRAFLSSPIGWSSIFAATAITLGVWMALHLFGMGVGLTAIDPDHPGTLRGVGIGTGVWSLIAPIIALFIGGLVAGRVAPTINTLNAVIHGGVVWAVSAIVTMLVLIMSLSAMTRTAVGAGTAIGRSAGSAISAAGSVDLEDLGLTGNDVVAPINQRLAQRGIPPVSAEDVEAVVKDAIRTAVRTGKIDRKALIASVTRHTQLSHADATVLASEIEQRIESVIEQAGETVEDVQTGALQVAETTGKVLLALFGAMALGLGAAVAGAAISVRRERREHVVLPRATSRVPIVTKAP